MTYLYVLLLLATWKDYIEIKNVGGNVLLLSVTLMFAWGLSLCCKKLKIWLVLSKKSWQSGIRTKGDTYEKKFSNILIKQYQYIFRIAESWDFCARAEKNQNVLGFYWLCNFLALWSQVNQLFTQGDHHHSPVLLQFPTILLHFCPLFNPHSLQHNQ